jgi:hypothetical protein
VQIDNVTRPFESTIAHCNLVPVKVIEPDRNAYETSSCGPS